MLKVAGLEPSCEQSEQGVFSASDRRFLIFKYLFCIPLCVFNNCGLRHCSVQWKVTVIVDNFLPRRGALWAEKRIIRCELLITRPGFFR